MKVLLIDNSVDSTGASKSLLHAIRGVQAQGIAEFVFVFPKGSKRIATVRSEGFTAYELPIIEIKKSITSLLLYFPYLLVNSYRLSRIAKAENVKLIHVNDLYNMLGLTSKMFRKAKVITHVRRMPESFPQLLYKTWTVLNIRFADKIIAVSQANKNALPANVKTLVIYNPLPEAEKYPIYEARTRLSKEVKILYLANYNIGKGHPYAIELMARAKNCFPDWKFVLDIYGTDFGLKKNQDYKRGLAETIIQKGLQNVVRLHQKVEDVEKTMKDHDIIFNLSDSESFSRLTLEALFFGLPTIATNVGGTNEMVMDRETGILVNKGDIDSMYEGFITLIMDDDLRLKISMKAYQFVRERFGLVETIEKLANVYKDLADTGKNRM